MEGEWVYVEQGFMIDCFVEKFDVFEYQLCVLINKGMGYWNFSVFVNGYRIEVVKKMLSDLGKVWV